jgi:hypothetical protein
VKDLAISILLVLLIIGVLAATDHSFADNGNLASPLSLVQDANLHQPAPNPPATEVKP